MFYIQVCWHSMPLGLHVYIQLNYDNVLALPDSSINKSEWYSVRSDCLNKTLYLNGTTNTVSNRVLVLQYTLLKCVLNVLLNLYLAINMLYVYVYQYTSLVKFVLSTLLILQFGATYIKYEQACFFFIVLIQHTALQLDVIYMLTRNSCRRLVTTVKLFQIIP